MDNAAPASGWGNLHAEIDNLLAGMRSNLCVTDPETDRILFMSQAMKEDYGLDCPEGEICWKVLQSGQEGRCPFCPIPRLQQSNEEVPMLQWDEVSSVAGRMYRNYESLVPWIDGKAVHVRQSIDITELASGVRDDLTGMMSRRAGKDRLALDLLTFREEGRTLSVCLYDINGLKDVNDTFGHVAGDRLIRSVAQAVERGFAEGDFGFRLSGDEFVCVFHSDRAHAHRAVQQAAEELAEGGVPAPGKVDADVSIDALFGDDPRFSFGIVEVRPENPYEVYEVLAIADERMYEQKRRFHIERNARRALDRQQTQPSGQEASAFTYNKDRLYDAIVESTDDYLYVCNMKTGVFRYPRSMVEEFGLPSEVVENAAAVWGSHVHEDDRAAFLESNQEIVDGRATRHCVEYRAQNRKGEWVWLRCRGHLIVDEDGAPELFAGFITNLGKKNKVDHLTGLFNKFEFEDALRAALEDRSGEAVSLMILGIDDLRHINDRYDRAFGDDVVRIVAQKIQSLLPGRMAVYRLDGDEFAVIARGAGGRLHALYRELSEVFRSQREHGGKKYYCTLSAGSATYPDDAATYEDLVKFANYALEYAKAHGKKRWTRFSRDILAERTRELELMELLRDAVEQGFRGFSLCFQPQVDAESGQVVGAEALCRWTCEKYGPLPPLEFIPLLERSGLIVPVGAWVLREAAKTCQRWRAFNPLFTVSVNLSYRQLEEAQFASYIEQVLDEVGLPPENLVVEMTESYFPQAGTCARSRFAEIHSTGVRVAMDDFGTGYSALGILKENPADIVKIDRMFVRDILDSTFDATFIRFIVELCHTVGIRVCLEGIETREEYAAVSGMGLDLIQGFLFGRPHPADEFERRFLAEGGEGGEAAACDGDAAATADRGAEGEGAR